jgi:hypothetical protein
MTKIGNSFSILTFALLSLLFAGAAQAQATRTWVSGVGDDANPCSRTAPCKTFAGAISKTAAGGEINVLDPGGFGAVTITKAITIANDGVGTAGILVSGTNGVVVAAGVNDVVALRGLDFDGLGGGPSAFGLAGIQFNSGAALLIDNCKIYGFQAPGGAGSGINFQPTTAAKLWVTDTVISNNGSTGGALGGSGGILVQPQSGGSATAHLERVQILNSFNDALRADGSIGGAGATNVELNQVVADGGGGNALVAAAAAAPKVTMMIDNTTASNNVGYGVRAVGASATIRLTRSTVTGNGTGIGVSGGGALISYSNNNVSGNVGGNDGSPSGTVLPK